MQEFSGFFKPEMNCTFKSVDYETASTLKAQEIDIFTVLKNNDAYNALAKCDGLIITGPTGTNVNDVAVALLGA